MKSIIKLVTIVVIIFSFQWGCKENSITDNNPVSEQTTISKHLTHSNMASMRSEVLDENNSNCISKIIDGEKGGLIVIHNQERKGARIVITTGTLFIPRGAFTGTKEIKIYTNHDIASVQFYPPMKFDRPLVLNLLFTGFNETELDTLGLLGQGDIGFYFVPDQGPRELISNDGIIFKLAGGRLGVNNARLNHFSRYCWSK